MIRFLYIFITVFLICAKDIAFAADPVRPGTRADFAETARLVARRLPERHITHKPVNDALSAKAFNNYLSSLDADHIFFLQADIDLLAGKKLSLDDDLISGDTSFAFKVFDIFKLHVSNRCEYVKTLLDKGFDFTQEESYTWNRKHAPWPRDEAERDDLWRRKIKNEYLTQVIASNMADKKEKSSEKPPDPKKNLLKNYNRFLSNIGKLEDGSVLERYLCAFTRAYDPHCEYMSPDSVDEFDISMKLSLGGIGASLSLDDDGVCKVTKILPDSPAGRDKRDIRLSVGDKIVSVAQSDGQPVDILNMPIYRIVRLLRGKKGTKVILTVIPASDPSGTTTRKVDIIRDEVKLEEGSASLTIKQAKGSDGIERKLGVINLPSFYGDAKGAASRQVNAKSCSKDIKKILQDIKKQDLQGAILDIRHNGGGSLMEAVLMIGLFIESGPAVIVREGDASLQLLGDNRSHLVYSGPLVVLVDQMSASASEVVAGALQDYGRAIIVGASKTHGKGSVQTFVNLNPDTKAGSIKVTNALYYRVTGSSTQLKGVSSDIVLPSFLDALQTGEDFLPDAMEWSMIQSCRFKPFLDMRQFTDQLEAGSIQRRNTDKAFTAYTNTVAMMEQLNKMEEVPLNMVKRTELAERQRELRKIQDSFSITNNSGQTEKKPDIILTEALNILADLAAVYPEEVKNMDKGRNDEPDNTVKEKSAAPENSGIPESTRKEIVDLINKLGDNDSKVRKASITRIRELGIQALPVLKEHRNHSDPEIRHTIRELFAE